MARHFPADTRRQRALEELYEKEARAQIAWFLKSEKAKKDHPGKILTPAAISETPLPKLEDVLPPHLMGQIHQIHQVEKKPKVSIQPSLTTTSLVEQNVEPVPDMFPMDQSTQLILYNGISKEGGGRLETLISFLRKRYFS